MAASRKMIDAQLAHALSLKARKSVSVGDFTFPYKKPRGTVAVRVERIEGSKAFLSDGTEMHTSYAVAVPEGSIAS